MSLERIAPPAPGIYYGVSFDEYRRWDAINSSTLREARRSMAHVKAALAEPDSDSDSKRLGRLVHMGLLEPDRLKDVILPPINPKTGKPFGVDTKAYAEFVDQNPGKQIASEEDLAAVAEVVNKVEQHPEARDVVLHARSAAKQNVRCVEASLVWQRHGVVCKARTDVLRPGIVWADIKTTTDARPEAFSKTIAEYGYHFQLAMYADGLKAVGQPEADFIWIVIENAAPFEVMVFAPNRALREIGEAEYERAIRMFADARRTKHWPGYMAGVHEIDLPSWYGSQLIGSGA